jgi:hypothetical protein
MKRWGSSRPLVALCAAAALFALSAGVAGAKVVAKRITAVSVSVDPNYGMARMGDGSLHLLLPTTVANNAVNGLAAVSISPSGKVGTLVQALSGWQPSIPGLTVLPNGSLQGVFGSISPGPNSVSSLWGINSTDGGQTWSAPTDVKNTSNVPESLAYGSNITAQTAKGVPILTIPQAGNLVIQSGLGLGSTNYQVPTNSSDNSIVDVGSALNEATGQVVASWQSLATPGGLFLEAVSPTAGAAQLVPGQRRSAEVIAGRDTGPGVFGAYSPDNAHVRLLRYGGGSIAVGKLGAVTAKVMGVATGPDGRIWVMWGDDSGTGPVALTRSNKAVNRFEPIQQITSNAFSLYRLSGDGRLGPLDLLIDEIPDTKGPVVPDVFYARVLPELSASVSVKTLKKKGKVTGHQVEVKVADAGDAVKGAKVSLAGKSAKTNAKGLAKLKFGAGTTGKHKLKVTAAGYQVLQRKVKL